MGDGSGGDGSGGDGPSVAARDDLAGVVDLFGALDRPELRRALAELAFKRGEEVDEAALDDAIAAAIDGYYLVPVAAEAVTVDGGPTGAGDDEVAGDPADADPEFLAAGPVAFPSLPPGAEDLPHILDIEPRALDREALGTRARERLQSDAETAVETGDGERVAELSVNRTPTVDGRLRATSFAGRGPVREIEHLLDGRIGGWPGGATLSLGSQPRADRLREFGLADGQRALARIRFDGRFVVGRGELLPP